MAYPLAYRGVFDGPRIRNTLELEYWARLLGVAREELAAAIKAAGDRVADAADYLAQASASGPSS